MASGKVHDITSLTLAGCLLATTIYFGVNITIGLTFGMACAVAGLWLSPDLDISQSRPSRRWSALTFIWSPLRLYGHRSKFSHGWIISTTLCLLYVGLLLSPLLYMLPATAWPYVGWLTLGAAIGREFHLVVDLVTTGDNDRYHKRRRR